MEDDGSCLKAIRGAVQIASDTPELIAEGTLAMLEEIMLVNDLRITELISLFFTITPDLLSELPPLAAYEAGWTEVPMLCAAEVQSRSMLPRVIRVLAHVTWPARHREPQHVYLPGTSPQRPGRDLSVGSTGGGDSNQYLLRG